MTLSRRRDKSPSHGLTALWFYLEDSLLLRTRLNNGKQPVVVFIGKPTLIDQSGPINLAHTRIRDRDQYRVDIHTVLKQKDANRKPPRDLLH